MYRFIWLPHSRPAPVTYRTLTFEFGESREKVGSVIVGTGSGWYLVSHKLGEIESGDCLRLGMFCL